MTVYTLFIFGTLFRLTIHSAIKEYTIQNLSRNDVGFIFLFFLIGWSNLLGGLGPAQPGPPMAAPLLWPRGNHEYTMGTIYQQKSDGI